MVDTEINDTPVATRSTASRRMEELLNDRDRKRMMRKLTLWHSRTFQPITTHDELEPIMASVGFIPFRTSRPCKEKRSLNPQFVSGLSKNWQDAEPGLTGVDLLWREYTFRDRNLPGLELKRWPRPRLPYPRVDGLHLMAYQAFFVSLEYYLGPYLVSNLFHVRSMPFRWPHDKQFEKVIRVMEERVDKEIPELPGSIFYRANTLDYATRIVSGHFSATLGDLSCSQLSSAYVRKDRWREIEVDERDESDDFDYLVPLDCNVEADSSMEADSSTVPVQPIVVAEMMEPSDRTSATPASANDVNFVQGFITKIISDIELIN